MYVSLYNYLFGVNENADVLLGVIGFTMEDFERFRDIYLNPEGDIITVLTRLGGLNRKKHNEEINKIKKSELYMKDYDDEYDNTYAYFEFGIPEKYQKMCKNIAPKEKRKTIHELFEDEMKQSKIPGTPAYDRMQNISNELLKMIKSDKNFLEI